MLTRQIRYCLTIPLCLDFKYSSLVHPCIQYIINVPTSGAVLSAETRGLTSISSSLTFSVPQRESVSLWLGVCRSVQTSCLHWTYPPPSLLSPLPPPWNFIYWSILSDKLGLSFWQTEARNCLSSLILCVINTDAKHVVDGACQNQL